MGTYTEAHLGPAKARDPHSLVRTRGSWLPLCSHAGNESRRVGALASSHLAAHEIRPGPEGRDGQTKFTWTLSIRMTGDDNAKRNKFIGAFFFWGKMSRGAPLGFEITDQLPARPHPCRMAGTSPRQKQGCAGGGGTALRHRADSDSALHAGKTEVSGYFLRSGRRGSFGMLLGRYGVPWYWIVGRDDRAHSPRRHELAQPPGLSSSLADGDGAAWSSAGRGPTVWRLKSR